MNNIEIAKFLYDIADFLEATKNRFRARAYRKAANVISNLKIQVTSLLEQNFDLQELPYIGINISNMIKNILLKRIDPINFILKNKTAPTNIQKPPFRLHHAKKLNILVTFILKSLSSIGEVYCVGELRRNKELIKQLEFLAVVNDSFSWDDLTQDSYINNVQIISKTKAKLVLLHNIPIILHITKDTTKGKSLLLLTGSEVYVRKLKDQLKNNLAGYQQKSEKEIYNALKLNYIEPELREDSAKSHFSSQNSPPKLIQIVDIKGDLHCHTNETDGVLDLEKVVEYAMLLGYEYLAITDHSQSLKITHGLDKKRLIQQIKKIDKINAKLKNFTILKSSECDILADGSLDFPNDILKELDLVVCSIHSKFRMTKEKQTDRLLRAIENRYCSILGHPTGRLINSRLAYEFDMEKIMLAAKAAKCVMELNCQPYRLDLSDEYCMLAKSLGIKVAISSDAHSLRGFHFIELGITQARRAGLEAKDVINTHHLDEMKKLLRRT